MLVDIPKTYDKQREKEIYSGWEKKGYFRAFAGSGKNPYTIVIPPPNITAKLHMGHAFNNTIQDILVRFKRMQGFEALWMPGTDHAAIATEVLVVKDLASKGITKDDLGREGFLEKLWEWNELYGGTIIRQLKMLGCSCDWEKQRFTMDEGLSDAVLEVFVRLYNEGKIYRGERLVNWCVKCQTSISDAEVEHDDKQGNLFYFQYPVLDGSENSGTFIKFATTRPETMLGDTAIAVNPGDARFAPLVGKFAYVPMVEREIPIIADSYVDPEYGTGAVKITPAHDPNDFEVGNRHELPRINIMNNDGTINENGGAYAGLTREEARKKIIEDMSERGLYIKTEPISHSVGDHDRCGTTVEPLMKLQWFVQMEELAKPAIDAYKSGRLKFNRERFGKIYTNWLDNIRDWCISRQLWWGHQIPAYYCANGHVTVAKSAPAACTTCGDTNLKQDPDVLDTWFSSALWPFATLGWPDNTLELEKFYPTDVLVTDRGIIFHWVVRMVFMSEKFMGQLPFSDVIIHGTVLDELGRKMSKSLGNGIDPLEIIDEFGADVLRLMLINGTSLDNDMRFFRERLEPARNFLNKLWNATRFVIMNLGNIDPPVEVCQTNNMNHDLAETAEPYAIEDMWIISLCNRLCLDVTEKLEAHELGLATQKIVDFVWDEFCDWYVEMVKPRLYAKDKSRCNAQRVLYETLSAVLRLLHPITPFITEDLYLALQNAAGIKHGSGKNDETIMHSAWAAGSAELINPAAEKSVERIKEAVRGIRAVRTEKQVPPSQKISVEIIPSDPDAAALFAASKAALALLSGAATVNVNAPNSAAPAGAISIVILGATIYLPLDSLIDADKELSRLAKEKKKLEQEIARIDSKLSNQGFVAKAPPALIETEREKRKEFAAKLAKVESEIDNVPRRR
ncbi:MAG: valine--tRNA ligase [Defluviitaleaceae bacterium]|nr:valine--tRNA ligase [Defluviitaleaceae bacterium]